MHKDQSPKKSDLRAVIPIAHFYFSFLNLPIPKSMVSAFSHLYDRHMPLQANIFNGLFIGLTDKGEFKRLFFSGGAAALMGEGFTQIGICDSNAQRQTTK